MGTHATSTDVSGVRTALAGYVTSITHDDSDTQTLLQAQAQLALDLYADAMLAVVNLNAAAATSYSSGAGFSVTKRNVDDARAAANEAWSDFVRACGLGGVTVPTMRDAVAYWDLRGSVTGDVVTEAG